ncbi:AIR carboxylase family protein [Candidatus Woesearchaeota archaeon]|nr:AIR carboxylase family protein [Candidatus Woesearchaeota archaeon]
MPKVLIIFGSKSDQHIYKEISKELKEKKIDHDVRISSAHRTPDEVHEILQNPYDLIIAGAGLAAHLPGVVASKVLCPVIGVPVKSNYEGLDAVLSIMQMPPGIPVLGVGVDKAGVAAVMALHILKGAEKINLIGDKDAKAAQKCTSLLDEFSLPYEWSDQLTNSLNIKFASLNEDAIDTNELVIYVPLMDKDDDSAEAALNVLKHSKNGLWVGLNRGENAAIAAAEIMKKYDQLQAYRETHAEKVRESDKELQNA